MSRHNTLRKTQLNKCFHSYGSYKALVGGLTIEAAVDFTGGIPEMIATSRYQSNSETLFYNMMKAYENQAFMSCSLSVSPPWVLTVSKLYQIFISRALATSRKQ